jgi:hypothetical protein
MPKSTTIAPISIKTMLTLKYFCYRKQAKAREKMMADDVARTTLDDKLRQEMVEGLLYTHARLSDTTKKTLDAASFVYGLT